jgi:hypothetical protein
MDRERVLIRTATRQDIETLYPAFAAKSGRCWAVDYDGELAALAGVIREPLVMIAFSVTRPGLEVPPMTIWRTALKLWKNIRDIGVPVRAIADQSVPGSAAFLERLGFQYIRTSPVGDVYQW